MIYIHNIDPILISLGPIIIRWYGVMYLLGFIIVYIYLSKSRFVKNKGFTNIETENILLYGMIGVILGGRIGYFLFYSFQTIINNPLEILYVWHGGMSIHGGIIGVALALLILSRKYKRHFLEITDIIVVPAAIGLAFGRVGNFINGELWGRPTDQTWGVVFPMADDQLRHPSQLYSFIKQLMIASTLYITTSRLHTPTGLPTFMFCLIYGILRMIVEQLWREPLDGYIWGITSAQLYCAPLVIFGLSGIGWLWYKTKNQKK